MRILVAVDGSQSSDVATHVFSGRPWPEGSQVRVISVVQPFRPDIPEAGLALDYEQLSAPLLETAQQLVDGVAAVLRRLGSTVETKVRRGDPRFEIVDEAKEWRADLIVVGSHGRTGIERWLLGSVAEYVVRHAPCSVEVARTRAAAA